jgi:hypothetical protein
MSRHFEEARLVITADIAYDPESLDATVYEYLPERIQEILDMYGILNKNIEVELQGFICDGK